MMLSSGTNLNPDTPEAMRIGLLNVRTEALYVGGQLEQT